MIPRYIETKRARAWRRWNRLNLIALAQIYRPPEQEAEDVRHRPPSPKVGKLEKNSRRCVG